MNTHATIVLPRLAGVRAAAAEIATGISDLSAREVVVDASASVSLAQGFCDELVKQILIDRNVERLILRGVEGNPRRYFTESAARRGVSDRIDIMPGTPST